MVALARVPFSHAAQAFSEAEALQFLEQIAWVKLHAGIYAEGRADVVKSFVKSVEPDKPELEAGDIAGIEYQVRAGRYSAASTERA